ncbi:MAG TPA: bifunctional methionine sulfoxide reductase B/A protein [Pirellulales bacterium]|jgi:peptide methionine sulfoxide reductase msrA/msrB
MRTVHVVSALVAVSFLAMAVAIAAENKKASNGASARPGSPSGRAVAKDKAHVAVYVFNREGKLVGPVDSPRVKLSDAEWRKRLTKEQYVIARRKGTEDAFCGTLLDNKKEGVYTCVCCGLPLFSSNAKFESGTGWPSFFQPVAAENLAEAKDLKTGEIRIEVTCARCDGHLGHVFDDGPRPTGLRFCLNSESLSFTDSSKLASLADPAADKEEDAKNSEKSSSAKATAIKSSADKTSDEKAPGKATEKKGPATAVFASGCFWCSEASFAQLKGVSEVVSGYAGGDAATADYQQVSSGITGHAESIRVTYDPNVISYEKLLDVFFDSHDPTQLNAQGPDVGTQYRSAIFYADDEQHAAAEAKIKKLTAAKAYRRKIVTTLEPLRGFYEAEAYHQDYAANHPDDTYVRMNSLPHARKVRDKHPDLIATPANKKAKR